LFLEHLCELESQRFALVNAVAEDEVDEADVGVEHCLQENTPLDALNRDLSGDFLDGNVVDNLNQREGLRGGIDRLLKGDLFRSRVNSSVLVFNHLHDFLEPLRKHNGILSTGGLTKVFLEINLLSERRLEPLRHIFRVLIAVGHDAWLR